MPRAVSLSATIDSAGGSNEELGVARTRRLAPRPPSPALTSCSRYRCRGRTATPEASGRPYVAPALLRHHAAVGNRLPSDGAQHRVCDHIDDVPVADLVARYGSPLFVFSEARLRSRARAFRQAFASRYPRTRFGWSYKTNYLDGICAVLHQEGWDAEVVSDLEYAMARRLGMPGSRIICNGAHKPRAWLSQAIADGAFIQVDHLTSST